MDFIFMLTRDDQTVDDCLELVDEIAPLGLRHIGFKDVGVDFDRLRALDAAIKATGAVSYMEVVSTSREAELRSIAVAREIGVDRLLGGTAVERGAGDTRREHRLLSRSRAVRRDIRRGSAARPSEVEAQTARFVAQGCAGCDLLAYRATEADPIELVRAARRGLGDGDADRRRVGHRQGPHPGARRGGGGRLHHRDRGLQRRLQPAQGLDPVAAQGHPGRLRRRLMRLLGIDVGTQSLKAVGDRRRAPAARQRVGGIPRELSGGGPGRAGSGTLALRAGAGHRRRRSREAGVAARGGRGGRHRGPARRLHRRRPRRECRSRRRSSGRTAAPRRKSPISIPTSCTRGPGWCATRRTWPRRSAGAASISRGVPRSSAGTSRSATSSSG